MSTETLEILDCKVEVRKYVLVSRLPKSRQKGERVVVQSPMLEIPENVSRVPVKRYNGDEQNAVCYIQREDIEKDSTSVYEKALISRAPVWADAHGVALFNSSTYENLTYRRGDRFWIYIGPSTKGDGDTVPVINLRTFESGTVAIDQVCWYPKLQGPNQELWTLGGPTRELKLSGSRKYSYFSWLVCQRLDETESTTKELKIDDGKRLSSSEAKALFEKRYEVMLRGSLTMNLSTPPPDTVDSPKPSEVEPLQISTPPVPPDEELLVGKQVAAVPSIPDLVLPLQAKNTEEHIALWKRIFEMGSSKQFHVLQNSPIHPQELPELHGGRIISSTSTTTPPDEEDRDLSDDSWSYTCSSCISSCSSSRSSSPAPSHSREEHHFISPGFSEPGTPDAVRITMDVSKDDKNKPAISVTTREICDGTKSIADQIRRMAPYENSSLKDRCSLGDPYCMYTSLWTVKHFHSPPEQCNLAEPTTSWKTGNSSSETSDRECHPHEHCISRLRLLPGGAGECMLAEIPSREHRCCHRKVSDPASIDVVHKRAHDDCRVPDTRKKRMTIHGRGDLIRESPGRGEMEWIQDCEENIGSAGLMLKRDLERGLFDDEMANLPSVVDSSRMLMDDLSIELGLAG